MNKKPKVITIPLSKILPLAVIIFVVFQIFSKPKTSKEIPLITKDTTTVKIVFSSHDKELKPQKGNVSTKIITQMSHDDVANSLKHFPPNLAQNCDTIIYQNNEIIRYFSIDTALQRKTETLVRRAKTKYGAAVAINPQSGQILALVSLFDEDSLPKITENLCLSNVFPAASIIKTITAESAFSHIENISSSTEFAYVGKSTTLYKSQYLPENFSGNVNSSSFAEAFAKSNNPVFARLAIHSLGQENLVKSAQKFGFNSKIPFEMPCDVSVFPKYFQENQKDVKDSIYLADLGSGFNDETTLTPLLGALLASSIINKGNMMTPTIIDSVCDMSGKMLYSSAAQIWKNSISVDIADSLNILMQETTKNGSARKSFAAMKKFASGKDIVFGGKTGTKDSELGRNEWFVGFAKDCENDFAIAISMCFVQYPQFMFRPAFVSADVMTDYLRKTRKQIKEKEKEEEEKNG